jgi:hypothetical protein
MKTLWKILAPSLLLASVAGWGQPAAQTPSQTPSPVQTPTQTPAPDQSAAPADDPVVGDWKGNIAADLPIFVHIALSKGAYVAVTDSPAQGVAAIPTTVAVDGNTITIRTVAATPSRFTGTITGRRIAGTFTEGGSSMSLTLTRTILENATLAGDWQGSVVGGVPLILHITETPRGFSAATDSPSLGISGIRTAIAMNANVVKMQFASKPPAQFVGVQEGSALIGAFTQARNVAVVTFTKSIDAAASAVVGDWQGNITSLVPIVFHIRVTGRGFVAATDSPALGKTNIRTAVAVNGSAVKLRIADTPPSTFTGIVDGNTLTGVLTTGRSSTQITLNRMGN